MSSLQVYTVVWVGPVAVGFRSALWEVPGGSALQVCDGANGLGDGGRKRAELIEGRGEVYAPLSLAESLGFPTFRVFFSGN